jgi:hypothetical protein
MQAILSFLAGVIVLFAWHQDHLWGIRICGAFTLLWGGYSLYVGRIPFLFNQRHVGNITGAAALLIALAIVGVGAFLIALPELAVPHFDPVVEYAPWRR